MSERVLEILLGVKNRKLRRELRSARRDIDTFAQGASNRLRSSFKDAFGAVAGLGSVAGLASIGKGVLDVDRKLTRLGIQAGKSKAFMHALNSEFDSVSDATGLSSESLVDAAAKFVSITGSMDDARAGAEAFAKTAQAGGVAIDDVAAAAASLQKNLSISGASGFEKGLSILLTQGKQGAVELRELAGLLPSIAPSFTKFGRAGTEGLAELGAALQVIRGGFGSGAEAATGLNALMKKLGDNAHKFKGVEIFETDPETGAKTFRQFSAIIKDISESKLMQDPQALSKAFGSSEAMRAFFELANNQKSFQDLIKVGLESNAVQEDFGRYMESNAGRIEKAWTRMQNTLARQLTPERVDDLVEALEGLGETVAFVVQHVRHFGIAMGALKLAQWTTGLYGLASSAAQLGGEGSTGITRFARGVGALGAIGAVGTLSYEIGTLLDKTLKLSDALAGIEDTSKGRGELKEDVYLRQTRAAIADLEGKQATLRRGGRGAFDLHQRGFTPEKIQDKLRYERLLLRKLESRAAAKRGLKTLESADARIVKPTEAEILVGSYQRSGLRPSNQLLERVAAHRDAVRSTLARQAERQTGKDLADPETKALLEAMLVELKARREQQIKLQLDSRELRTLLEQSPDITRSPTP
ncbi:MAG: phage tail tape measure protein [Proteobacteria bacterium]|nr:phage tail tape measure protein [Pseudomonadota bacterium]